MAPRKRTTKQRKNNPKMAKLEAFLEDFDSEVKTRMEQMREQLSQLLKNLDNAYEMALLKLPKAVRQMNFIEYCRSLETKNPKSPEVDNSEREEQAAIVKSIVTMNHAALLQTVKKTSRKKGSRKSSSDDETPSVTRKTRATKKPPTTSKRAKALSVNKRKSAIRRSNRKPLVTPARCAVDSSVLMGPTPLVTPRFDPRLPKTPAVRVPRHKERVYSVSVNGSPIASANKDIVINIPIGNGESLQLLASQMDSVDLSLLDDATVKIIRQLQNRLSALCGSSN